MYVPHFLFPARNDLKLAEDRITDAAESSPELRRQQEAAREAKEAWERATAETQQALATCKAATDEVNASLEQLDEMRIQVTAMWTKLEARDRGAS